MTAGPYDVSAPPPAEDWLAMDEGERIAAVEDAHRRTGAAVGQNPTAHATIHVVVETRLAVGDEVVVAAYDRCRAAGLDRHTAIHALASVVTRHMMAALEQPEGVVDQATADRDFDALDPSAWKRRR
jgi:Ser-tRNA(Ala) deacylase AlaX